MFWESLDWEWQDAAKQFEEMGIIIDYEYLAPNRISSQDQIRRLSEAVQQ